MFMMTMDQVLESTTNDSEFFYSSIKELRRIDIIYALESTTGKKEGILSKTAERIRKILKDCRELISKIIGFIGDHIRYGLLSKKQKERYDEFNKFLEENPQYKKKTGTVKDWQTMDKAYKTVEENIVAMMNDNKVDARGLNMKAVSMINDLTSTLNSATAAITVDMCLVIARKSPEAAEEIKRQLNNCSSMLDNIDAQLGDGASAKLQKDIDKLTKQSIGQKLLAKLFQQKEKSLTDSIKEVTSTFEKLMSGEATTLDKVKAGIEHRSLVTTAGKAYIHDEKTRRGVKTILGAKKALDNNSEAKSWLNMGKEFVKPKS